MYQEFSFQDIFQTFIDKKRKLHEIKKRGKRSAVKR